MSSTGSLQSHLTKETTILGLQLWILICLCIGFFFILILSFLSVWVVFHRKSRKPLEKFHFFQFPMISKEIRVDTVQAHSVSANFHGCESISLHSDQNSEKCLLNIYRNKWNDFENLSQCSSYQYDRCGSSYTGDEGNSGASNYRALSPFHGVHLDFSQFGWGHWFTMRDLELATNGFSNENVIGEGGYGIVYKGQLINGTEIAIKRLLNNTGQAEKEFKVEVEAMSHLRHKNLVRLLGYCIEGIHRLAYLHEAIEPKVVHRDIKASNILVDKDLNAKVSDFGLAKLLGSDRNHIATRVMGTFGYVAPEYANTGLLNEKSDVYSFGVLLIESITGRDPVDYTRPANEVNLVEWLKMMIGNRRMDEVLDPSLENKPTSRALKRALIVAIKCVDLVSEERPKMGQVVQMLENAEISFREGVRRNRHNVHMSDNIDFSRNNSCLNPVANSASHNGKQNEIAVSS